VALNLSLDYADRSLRREASGVAALGPNAVGIAPAANRRHRHATLAEWFGSFIAHNPACFRVLAFSAIAQAVLGLVTVPFYASAGLTVAWATAVPHLVLIVALPALFLYFVAVPGSSWERGLPDAMLVAFLLILLTNVASPAQYLAVTIDRPLVDAHLAAADAWIGIHVPALAAWTSAHAAIASILKASYFTLLPQFFLPILVLGMWSADRERLWEYCFHFHFCLLATIATLALWPAECAFQHYGFQSTIDQSRFIHHFTGLRNGTFHVIRFDDLEGLISMPSFHVAGALMVTWAFRGYRAWRYPLVALNVCLVLATFMSGAHYFVDVLATVALFGASLAAYRCCRWMSVEPGRRRVVNAQSAP
jgi:PAP2 superfamily protein